MKTAQYLKSPAAFRKHAERIVREEHPDASIAFEWTRCNRCTWHDGSPGLSGTVTIKAPGYRTRSMIATATTTDISVR